MIEIQDLFDLTKTKTHWVDDGGMLWIHGQKLCAALGFQNASQTIAMHVELEDKQLVDVGGIQDSWFVSEPGMWSLILAASKSAKAKEFKRVLTREILPNIRKHGYYLDPKATRSQLAELQSAIVHHKNWTVDEYQEVLTYNRSEIKALHS